MSAQVSEVGKEDEVSSVVVHQRSVGEELSCDQVNVISSGLTCLVILINSFSKLINSREEVFILELSIALLFSSSQLHE